MKLPLTLLPYFPITTPSHPVAFEHCLVAVDAHAKELELYSCPAVIGQSDKIYFFGTAAYLKALEASIRQMRKRQGGKLSELRLARISDARLALQNHLDVTSKNISHLFLAGCLSTIRAPLCVTEIPADSALIELT